MEVVVKVEINKPVKEVSEYVFDPVNDSKWIVDIKSAKIITEGPIGKGARVQRFAKFMGKTIDYTLEIVEFEPHRLMVMKSVKAPFPMDVIYKFDPVDQDTTLFTQTVGGSAKGFYGIADFLMAPMVKRNVKRDMQRLKGILEV